MSEEPKKPITLDRLARLYVKIRDARAAASAAHNKQDEEFKQQLETLQQAMLPLLGTLRSARTEDGLNVIKILDIQPNVKDWDLFYDWIVKEDAFEALERRVKKTFIQEYRERRKEEQAKNEDDHGPLNPPGVAVIEEYKIQVKKR